MIRSVVVAVAFSLVALTAQDVTYPGTRVKYLLRWGNPAFYGTNITGGYRSDAVTGVALNAAGNVIVAGRTYSQAFPGDTPDPGSLRPPRPTGFVGMLKPDGGDFVWLTTWDQSAINTMAVDSKGNVIVAGMTYVTWGDSYLAKFDSSGKLVFTRPMQATPTAVAVDAADNIYVAGYAQSSYPTTSGVLQPDKPSNSLAGFVSKFDPTGEKLLYSTYFGGSGETQIFALAVDKAGFAYMAGATTSADFPVTEGALQPRIAGASSTKYSDGFVAKLNLTGTQLLFSTLLGGMDADAVNAIAVDPSGAVHVTGNTRSANFPVTPGAFLKTRPADVCTFVGKLNASGTNLVYSTYYGGTALAAAIAVDARGWAYITGDVLGELPVWAAINPSFLASTTSRYSDSGSTPIGEYVCEDGFLAAFNQDGSGLAVSTYLSGYGRESGLALALDTQTNIYVGGRGHIMPSPTPSSPPWGDAFLLKLGAGSKPPLFIRESITNAADFSTGLPLAGGAAAVFVDDLTGTGDVKVTFDGKIAPLYAVTPRQINFQVPFEIAYVYSQIQIAQGDAVASVYGVKNALSAPAVFTYDGVHGAIQHGTDYRLVTNSAPAQRGEVVTIYVTGLGTTTPPVSAGVPVPVSPLSRTTLTTNVWIGGQAAEVLFSGLTPGAFGLYQINARVPETVASGDVQVQVGLPRTNDVTSFFRPPVERISRPVLMPVR